MHMKKAVLLAVLCVMFIGCAEYHGMFAPPLKQETNIVLKENDFKYIQTNCVGSASSAWVLGMFPLNDPRIFSRALADMYSKIQGNLENKATQLVNWTYDYTVWAIFHPKFPIYHTETAVFRADLIEYGKQ